jgi:predicted enzyme related to lactoylglutathione lyase
MSAEKNANRLGTIGWFDLTVPNAVEVKDFYSAVVGWTAAETPMGDYADFTMAGPGGPVSGICHARGANAKLPPMWLIYLYVADLDASLAACKERGGELISGPSSYGDARYAVIRDPAGACCALFQAAP